MAKTIKFNLLLDNNPVRDIEMLQNNFCINDILEVYKNGLLLKWLKVRGFDEYICKVENINKKDGVVIQLIKIFDIKKDDKEIKEAIYSLKFEEDRKKSINEFYNKENNLKDIIDKYHQEYEDLIKKVIENKEDMAILKTISKEISGKYLKLFELDYEYLYKQLKTVAPLMIFAILMNEKLRFEFTKDNDIMKDLYKSFILDNQEKVNEFFYNNFEIFEKLKGANNV